MGTDLKSPGIIQRVIRDVSYFLHTLSIYPRMMHTFASHFRSIKEFITKYNKGSLSSQHVLTLKSITRVSHMSLSMCIHMCVSLCIHMCVCRDFRFVVCEQ